MNERIRSALRAEAAAHQPDREAMLDRITTAAMRDSGQPATHRRGPRARTAAVVAAVAVLFGGGGVGTWALTGSPGWETAAPAPTTPSPTVTPSPVDTAPVSVAPSPSATRTTTTTTAPPPPPKSPSASPSAAADPLRATGTVDPDGANIVTVTTTRKLTALEVVVRVARPDGLASRGAKQLAGLLGDQVRIDGWEAAR